MTVVLDAWAVVALLTAEPAGPRVARQVDDGGAAACTINLGEAYYVGVRRRSHRGDAWPDVDALRRRVQAVEPDWPLVRAAATLKATHVLSYADAFCVATAQRLRAPVWTGDPEIVALPDGVVEVVDLR